MPALADSALRGEAVFITIGEHKLCLAPAGGSEAAQAGSPRPGRGAWKGRVVIRDAFYEDWTAEEMGEQEN